jgi:Fe2+ transport system protein FeoA
MSELALEPGCPYCGTALLLAGACAAGACGAACGSAGGCALIRCPGCGRAWPHPRRSRLAWRLAAWLARRAAARAGRVRARRAPLPADSLAALAVGRPALIVSLGSAGEGLRPLAALGLVPGVAVRLRQRWPALVLELGETTVALDAALARRITVAPAEPAAAAQPSSGSSPS